MAFDILTDYIRCYDRDTYGDNKYLLIFKTPTLNPWEISVPSNVNKL